MALWWHRNGKAVLTAKAQVSFSLSLLFLGIMSWFFGSSYHMRYRVHNFKVLVVDFDGGVMGASLQAAYKTAFASSEFPTLEFASADKYSSPAAIAQAICHEDYWGAIYTHSGATDRFHNAISGTTAAAAYDSSDAMTYVFSETRYPATSDAFVKSNLAEITAGSRTFFYDLWNNSTEGKNASLANINLSDSAVVSAYLSPINPVELNLSPMSQGTRMYLNTVCMVLPMLTQFFFLMAVNGISGALKVYTNMAPSRIWVIRLAAAKVHALALALVFTGVVWAFREDWPGTGLMFARTWMIIWFYMEVNYLVLDSVIGSFIPMEFITFFFLSWVLMNVASTIFPFELNPGFYRIGYALPAHDTYLLLIQAWTNGCFRRDYIALPVLFSWWVICHFTTFLSTRKRVADAKAALASVPGTSHSDASKMPIDSEEATLSGDAMAISGKASQMTRDPESFSIHRRDDIEMNAAHAVPARELVGTSGF